MPAEPRLKRAVVFVDGQNLFYGAKKLWGYSFPNYDVRALAQLLCVRGGWRLQQARFYTGVPERRYDPGRHTFWYNKMVRMGRQGVRCFSRPLRYHTREVDLPDGSRKLVRVGRETGIDVRIALDVIGLAGRQAYDVAVIVSQDSDLSEAAVEVRRIARDQHRWMKVVSAFPCAQGSFSRGIDRTDWLPISRSEYDSCIDTNEYRATSPREGC